jgi:hypothetical protein
MGSPKVALLQAMLLVATRLNHELPALYRTVMVPLNVQVPFSWAHNVQVMPLGVLVRVGVGPSGVGVGGPTDGWR